MEERQEKNVSGKKFLKSQTAPSQQTFRVTSPKAQRRSKGVKGHIVTIVLESIGPVKCGGQTRFPTTTSPCEGGSCCSKR